MKIWTGDAFRCQKIREIVFLGFVVFIHYFIDQLLSVPIVRLVENAVCTRYYRDPNRDHQQPVPELECKIHPIQQQVIFLLGWMYPVDCLPEIATAFFWGYLADRLGRRAVMTFSCVGRLLTILAMLSIGLWSDKLPVNLILVAPLAKLIGGGSRIFAAMVQSIVSDLTSESDRTMVLYFMALLMAIANLTAPILESWALARGLQLPFTLATVLFAVLLVAIWASPESRSSSPIQVTTSSIMIESEEEPLLQDSVHEPALGAVGKLSWMIRSPRIVIFLVCTFLKRTGFFSESFFTQFASEKYQLQYQQTVWLSSAQAFGAALALGLVLPVTTRYLQQRNSSAWKIDMQLARVSFIILTFGYTSVWYSWSIICLAAGTVSSHT
ncbi:major facilitator superfamily domain-containing protein [Podospora fimiseda]|uniref:Major facilitator superfamily domain-containing protein n=1 Tax=Podospora fimiseda TaxID=252190 RepID=A0AAN6YM64_9PEZI|nr:major facilitator superfamily domain-containing protein [Podospora fimiseda]